MIETLATLALAAAVIFHAVTRPARATSLHQAERELIMKLADAAASIETAAGTLKTTAQSLSDAADKLGTLNDTTVLDQPVADLNDANTAMAAAVAKITALVPA